MDVYFEKLCKEDCARLEANIIEPKIALSKGWFFGVQKFRLDYLDIGYADMEDVIELCGRMV